MSISKERYDEIFAATTEEFNQEKARRTLTNLRNLTKEQIMSMSNFCLPKDRCKNIDLGNHKHDPETMSYILDNLMKYWFIWHISPDSLLFEDSIVEQAWDTSLLEYNREPYVTALTRHIDAGSFFEKVVKKLLVESQFFLNIWNTAIQIWKPS